MANLKANATNSIQEPTGNKPIRLLSEVEYTQLTQLKRLCEFWANADTNRSYNEVETPILALVKLTLGYRDQDQDQTSETENENEEEQENKPKRSMAKSIYARFPFEERTDLIGKKAPNHMAVKSRHLRDNPYNIPIDEYIECPECGKVAISGMKIYTNEENNWTDVWQRFRHESKNCSVRIERIDEALTWDKVFARRIKYNKRHGITLDQYKYPETEQEPEEVDETEEEGRDEIEAEATVN